MAYVRRIKRRSRYFIGCEGESEQGYAALLSRLSEAIGLSIHLDAQIVVKAGDPLALVQRAVNLIAKCESGGRPAYAARFLLLDTDLMGRDPDKDAEMTKIANANGLILVKQVTCIEAVFLRHFAGKQTHQPGTTADAMLQLRVEWPDYKKGTSGQVLAKKFSMEDVKRAAAQPTQTDLRAMLNIIGLL